MKKSILEIIQESVEGLYDAVIVDATTMHEFNALSLTPVEDLSAREIKRIRLREKMSRAFLHYI